MSPERGLLSQGTFCREGLRWTLDSINSTLYRGQIPASVDAQINHDENYVTKEKLFLCSSSIGDRPLGRRKVSK